VRSALLDDFVLHELHNGGCFVDVLALKIQLSDSAHDALTVFSEFTTESRGDVYVKVMKRLLSSEKSGFLCAFFVQFFSPFICATIIMLSLKYMAVENFNFKNLRYGGQSS